MEYRELALVKLWEDISMIFNAKQHLDFRVDSTDNRYEWAGCKGVRYILFIEYNLINMWGDSSSLPASAISLVSIDKKGFYVEYLEEDKFEQSVIIKEIYEHISPVIREAKLKKIGL
jgi:hypothetical protein